VVKRTNVGDTLAVSRIISRRCRISPPRAVICRSLIGPFSRQTYSVHAIWWRFRLDRHWSILVLKRLRGGRVVSASEAAAWCPPVTVTQGGLPRGRLRRSGGRACESAETRQGSRTIAPVAQRQNRAATSDFRDSDPHAHWSDALFICIPPDTPCCCPVQDCARPKQRSHASRPS